MSITLFSSDNPNRTGNIVATAAVVACIPLAICLKFFADKYSVHPTSIWARRTAYLIPPLTCATAGLQLLVFNKESGEGLKEDPPFGFQDLDMCEDGLHRLESCGFAIEANSVSQEGEQVIFKERMAERKGKAEDLTGRCQDLNIKITLEPDHEDPKVALEGYDRAFQLIKKEYEMRILCFSPNYSIEWKESENKMAFEKLLSTAECMTEILVERWAVYGTRAGSIVFGRRFDLMVSDFEEIENFKFFAARSIFSVYYQAREGICLPPPKEGQQSSHSVSRKKAKARFNRRAFQEGTRQSEWRARYNRYCLGDGQKISEALEARGLLDRPDWFRLTLTAHTTPDLP